MGTEKGIMEVGWAVLRDVGFSQGLVRERIRLLTVWVMCRNGQHLVPSKSDVAAVPSQFGVPLQPIFGDFACGACHCVGWS